MAFRGLGVYASSHCGQSRVLEFRGLSIQGLYKGYVGMYEGLVGIAGFSMCLL